MRVRMSIETVPQPSSASDPVYVLEEEHVLRFCRLMAWLKEQGGFMAVVELEESDVTAAIRKAKAKNARLRLIKERHENYLAEHKDDPEVDEELTDEVRVQTSE